MEAIVLITLVFVLIAQAVGLLVYYRKRHRYSNSAQNVATLLPGAVFLLLAGLGGLMWLSLAWWVEVEGLYHRLFRDRPSLLVLFGIYAVAGGLANVFLSIIIQLVIMLIHPPKYKTRRRRRRREPTPPQRSEAES